jgi:hypothetical protein
MPEIAKLDADLTQPIKLQEWYKNKDRELSQSLHLVILIYLRLLRNFTPLLGCVLLGFYLMSFRVTISPSPSRFPHAISFEHQEAVLLL